MLVTHDVEEAERLCDRIVVMHQGRVVADGTPSAIVSSLGGAATVSFTDPDLDLRRLDDVPGLARVSRRGPVVDVIGRGPILAHVGARLVELCRPPVDLRVHQPTLEDRFVDLVKETSR